MPAPSVFEILRQNPTPIGSIPWDSGVGMSVVQARTTFSKTFPQTANSTHQTPNINFYVVAYPIQDRQLVEPEYAEKWKQMSGWMTDLEVTTPFDGRIRLVYHRERTFKDEGTAQADVEAVKQRLDAMTIAEFAQMAEPYMGKLASNQLVAPTFETLVPLWWDAHGKLERCYSYPSMKAVEKLYDALSRLYATAKPILQGEGHVALESDLSRLYSILMASSDENIRRKMNTITDMANTFISDVHGWASDMFGKHRDDWYNAVGFSGNRKYISGHRIAQTTKDTLTKQEFENMVQRLWNRYMKDYYDDPDATDDPKNWQQWLAKDPDGVAMSAENDGDIYNMFLANLPENVTAHDLVAQYQAGQLPNVPYHNPGRILPTFGDVAAIPEVVQPWQYSPKNALTPEKAKEVWTLANGRANGGNKAAVYDARKELFLAYNLDPQLAEKIGVDEREIRRRVMRFSGIRATALNTHDQLNQGIPDDHQWSGIVNSAWFGRLQLKPEDIDGFVKSINVSHEGKDAYFGAPGNAIRRQLATTFLAIDTGIEYTDLNVEIGGIAPHSDRTGGRIGGDYNDKERKIRIFSGAQHTVSHELGHYLDYKWSRELGFEGQSLARHGNQLSEYVAQQVGPQVTVWVNKFLRFIQNLQMGANIKSEYYQDSGEVFARFVDSFVTWTEKKAQGTHYYNGDNWASSAYGDKFRETDYRAFVALLQEKSYIDALVGKQKRQVSGALDDDWFEKIAATREEYLQSIGIDPEVINWVVQQDDDIQKYLIGVLRKQPGLDLRLVQHAAEERAEKTYKPEETEKQFASKWEQMDYPEFAKWVLYVLKKARRPKSELDKQNQIREEWNRQNADEYGAEPYTIIQTNGQFVYQFGTNAYVQTIEELSKETDMVRVFGDIYQWYIEAKPVENIDIASYTYAQALTAASEWQLPGQRYKEHNVVYQWDEGRFAGWTIQQLTTENDLKCEGKKMHHCVGGYHDKVQRGACEIYSLRDPKNKPYATIEVIPKGRFKTTEQIKAHSDEEVIPEHYSLIEEWGNHAGIEVVPDSETMGCEHEDGFDYDNDRTHSCRDCGEEGEHEWENDKNDDYNTSEECGESGGHYCAYCGWTECHDWRSLSRAPTEWREGFDGDDCRKCSAQEDHTWKSTGENRWTCPKCEEDFDPDYEGTPVPESIIEDYGLDMPGDFDEKNHKHEFVTENTDNTAQNERWVICLHCGFTTGEANRFKDPSQLAMPWTPGFESYKTPWLELEKAKDDPRNEKLREMAMPFAPPNASSCAKYNDCDACAHAIKLNHGSEVYYDSDGGTWKPLPVACHRQTPVHPREAMRQLEAASKDHKGFFVALFLENDAAQKLVQEDGEEAEDMHITLCYCADVDTIAPDTRARALDAIAGIATEHPPLEGTIGGWGRFTGSPSSDGKEVVYASPDVPGLTALREDIAERLTTIGIPPRSDHGYTPHITLAYVDEETELIPKLDADIAIKLSAITIQDGNEKTIVQLTGEPISPKEAMFHFWLKTAASRAEYLTSIGATPEIVQFIESQPEEAQKWFINEFRKNPQLQLAQLQTLKAPKKQNPYTEHELKNAEALQARYPEISGFFQWLLVEFRRHRNPRYPAGTGYTLFENRVTSLLGMLDEARLIGDWARATGVQIASYSFEQAIEAQAEWHNAQAAEGNGTRYQEKNVVYQLGEANPQWQGWTIQQVTSPNDLTCEGNKMGHCVGSYAGHVQRGTSVIYSLRDPQNEPHVTLEMRGGSNPQEGYNIEQIQGKGNWEPIQQYKDMIGAWFKSLGPQNVHMGNDEDRQGWDIRDVFYNVGPEEYAEELDKLYSDQLNSYGIESRAVRTLNLRNLENDFEWALEYIDKEADRSYRSRSTPSWADDILGSFASLAFQLDRNGLVDKDGQISHTLARNTLLDKMYQWADKVQDWISETVADNMPPMPEMDDQDEWGEQKYENEAEHALAVQEWEKSQEEYSKELWRDTVEGELCDEFSEQLAQLYRTVAPTDG